MLLFYQTIGQNKQDKLAGLNLINSAQGKQSYVKEGSKGIIPGFIEGVSGAAGKGIGQGISNAFSGESKTPTQVG